MAVTVQKWGWYDTHKLKVQDKVFGTPDEALQAMRDRHGKDFEVSLQRMEELGFQLALVEVTYKPLMVMGSL